MEFPVVWWCTISLSFRRCDWLLPLSARKVSSGNRSNYKSTRQRVDSKGMYGRWRLHLTGLLRTQKAIVVSNFYGYQTQSKNYVFRRHFPSYFQNWEFAYSLSMLIFVPKGLIKMKKMMDYHAWFWIGVIFWCSGASHKLYQILPQGLFRNLQRWK